LDSRPDGRPEADPRTEWILPILLAAASTVLWAGYLWPDLDAVSPFDEASEIDAGRRMVRGELPGLAGNPLVGAFYGVIRLCVAGSPVWLAEAARIGRILLHLGLIGVALELARSFGAVPRRPLVMSLAFLTSAPVLALTNPSDALYAVLTALALEHSVRFSHTARRA
jgi:hypothetical protein